MNLKVRIKNPVFWLQIIGTAFLTILAYFGMTGAEITSWPILFNTLLDALLNPYVLALVVMSVWNSINDPTTKGLQDSELAKTYQKPN